MVRRICGSTVMLMVLCMLIAGCGGSGGDGTSDDSLSVVHPMTGTWSGTWTDPEHPDLTWSNTALVTVSMDGQVTGTLFNSDPIKGVCRIADITGGNIDSSGLAEINLHYRDGACCCWQGQFALQDPRSLQGVGALEGNQSTMDLTFQK